MGTTAINALRYPELADPANARTFGLNLATDLDTRLVPRFTGPTARDAAITAPTQGQVCYTTDVDMLWRYTGSRWLWAYPKTMSMQTDQSWTANTTYASITALSTTVLASGLYRFKLEIGYQAGNSGSSKGLKVQFLAPSNSTHSYGYLCERIGGTDFGVTQAWIQAAPAATGLPIADFGGIIGSNNRYGSAHGLITIGGSGGTLALQAAQNVSDANTTFVLTGTTLQLTHIA